MNPEQLARLQLFASIEGGSAFWSYEIEQQGASATLDRLLGNHYDEGDHALGNIRARILAKSAIERVQEIVQAGAQLITPDDIDWPIQLNELPAPPIALIIKGDRAVLTESTRSLAIVGTRNPTPYGNRIAGDLAAGAVDRDWLVVSGGAYGIDSMAHQATLLAGGRTVAFLAGGFEHNYPAGNERLFNEIAETGLLVSEVMPSVRAEPFRFLTRNRLIAALSKGTIVVEAAYRSGSLRTAREAAELMRLVMAVPGPITSPTSEGCHRLISERSAELVTSISEVMELVNPLGSE